MVPCKSSAEEVSFEWLHQKISSTDAKVRDSRSKGLELKIYYNPLCEIGPKANRINGVLVVRGGGGGGFFYPCHSLAIKPIRRGAC